MKHLRFVSKKTPASAVDIPVKTKIQFITAILTAFEPILEAKDTDGSSNS